MVLGAVLILVICAGEVAAIVLCARALVRGLREWRD